MTAPIAVVTASLAASRQTLARGWEDLSEAERARAACFAAETDRARYVAAHAALRAILGRTLGADPAALMFSHGRFGKPCLVAGGAPHPLRFNLAHSGDLMAVALSWKREVGIDIERRRAIDAAELDAMIELTLAEESEGLRAVSPARRADEFFRLWTRKEAMLKGHGLGFARASPGPRNMAVREIDLGRDVFAALAAEGEAWPVRIERFAA